MSLKISRNVSVMYFVTIIAFGFYGLLLTPDLRKLLSFFIGPILFLITSKTLFKKNSDRYSRIAKYLFIGIILSYIPAFLFWGQSPILSYRVTSSSFLILLYFYMYGKNIGVNEIEKYIMFFGVLYVILWAAVMLINPFILISEDDADTSRGMIRLRLAGSCLMIFAYFLSLNKYIYLKKKIYLFLLIVFFTVMVLQLVRQLILFASLVSVIYIFSKKIKLLFLSIAIFATSYSAIINIDPESIPFAPVRAMVLLTERQAEENEEEENIRIIEYREFFTNSSKNIICTLFGNSYPHSESAFGRWEKSMSNKLLYISDVGYAQIFITVGVIGLMVYILFFVNCFFVRLPDEYVYVKLYVLFLALYILGTNAYWFSDGQISLAVVLYLLTKLRLNQHSTSLLNFNR